MSYHRAANRSWMASLTLLSLISLFVPLARAKSKDKEKQPQEQRVVGIYLIGHLPLPETTVSNIAAAIDGNRQLLQLTDASHGTVAILDVTTPAQPKLIEQIQLPVEFANASVQIRVGNSALLAATSTDSSAHGDPRSVTLVSVSGSSQLRTVQKFEGVTAVWSDHDRELIYLANADGLWVLEVYSAADKRAEEQFDEMLRASQTGG